MIKTISSLAIILCFVHCGGGDQSVFADALTYYENHTVKNSEVKSVRVGHFYLVGLDTSDQFSILFFEDHLKREEGVTIVGVDEAYCKKISPLLLAIEDTCFISSCKAISSDTVQMITMRKDYSFDKTIIYQFSNGSWGKPIIEKSW